MSNVLKASLQTTIYSLADRGWSQRRIASELEINRETVRRYLRLAFVCAELAGLGFTIAHHFGVNVWGAFGRRPLCESCFHEAAVRG
jgi:hypothetical protein